MARGQRKIKPEFWVILVIIGFFVFALMANWWKTNAALGWVLLAVVVGGLGFAIYRFPGFRQRLFSVTKSAGERLVFEKVASDREPVPPKMRQQILDRARNRCENPDCKANVSPHIHHIDNDNAHNSPRNLVVLCPNCHKAAHDDLMTNSQLRNWVQRSWASYRRGQAATVRPQSTNEKAR